MTKRPNIVIFNPDSYRGDVVGHLGNAGAVTPNLDRLVVSGGGVSFANAFAQNPVCTPSRCSFMTGWYPHTCGHRSMKNMLKPYEPNLFSVLRREGYHVWWGGKNDLFAVESQEDYLKYCDMKYRGPAPAEFHMPDPPVAVSDRRYRVFYRGLATRTGTGPLRKDSDGGNVLGAVKLIEESRGDQPLCLYLPLSNPHPAYVVEEDFYDMIDPRKLPPRLPVPERDLPMLDRLREGYRVSGLSEDDWRDIKRIYYGMCAKIDHLFGMVVDALVRKGIYDDTLIFFLSDHGDFAGDYSLPEKTHGSLQDALIRSPLLIKPHAGIEVKSGVRNHLAELVDMTATIYDLLGIDPEYSSYGRSLRGGLAGDDCEIRPAVFAEVGSRKGEMQFMNLDVKEMDPESFYGVQSQYALPAHEAGSYAICCRTQTHKYVRRAYVDHNELYDLRSDPGELVNISGQAAHADVERHMQTLLLDHFMTTGDVMPHEQDSRKV